LHSDLRNPEYACEACEPTNLFAACEIRSACWEHKYICEGARSGRRSKQDEVWREAERRTAVDDADVLREVGYEDADKYESRRNGIRNNLGPAAVVRSYSETAKLVVLGEDKSSQCVCMTPFRQDPTAGQINATVCYPQSRTISWYSVGSSPLTVNVEKCNRIYVGYGTKQAAIDMLSSA
jgi:hypothetical protein